MPNEEERYQHQSDKDEHQRHQRKFQIMRNCQQHSIRFLKFGTKLQLFSEIRNNNFIFFDKKVFFACINAIFFVYLHRIYP